MGRYIPPADPRDLVREVHPHMTVDHRFGRCGDQHSGTLTCNWPDCPEPEVFTRSWEADEAADAHWAAHQAARAETEVRPPG